MMACINAGATSASLPIASALVPIPGTATAAPAAAPETSLLPAAMTAAPVAAAAASAAVPTAANGFGQEAPKAQAPLTLVGGAPLNSNYAVPTPGAPLGPTGDGTPLDSSGKKRRGWPKGKPRRPKGMNGPYQGQAPQVETDGHEAGNIAMEQAPGLADPTAVAAAAAPPIRRSACHSDTLC